MPSTTSTPTPDRAAVAAAGDDDDGAAAVFPFGEPDPRLENFLDDKLQTAADLGTVDMLLAAVAEQNRQLTEQLDGAAAELVAARAAAAAERATLQARLDEFAALEAAVAGRLAVANAADAAPEAVVRRLAGPLAQRQRVALAHDYLVLVQAVAALAEEARRALKRDDAADAAADDDVDPYTALVAASEGALPPYTRLRQLATRVAALRPAADMAATHVAAHVAAVAGGVGADVTAAMRAAFAALVAQRGWPAQVDAGVRADATWRDAFARMVQLQAALEDAATATATATATLPATLLPVDIMADLFVKEFRYHFLSRDSGRQTSDPRQIADVCFPWFLARVDTWAAFLRASFADVLVAAAAARPLTTGTPAAGTAVYTDPACAFVAALLPVMQDKVQQTAAYAVQVHRQAQAAAAAAAAKAAEAAATTTTTTTTGAAAGEPASADTAAVAAAAAAAAVAAPAAASGPSFLSSFIVQLLAFDDALRTRYGFDGGCAGGPAAWPGLAGAVLDEHFGLWLQAEKDQALARYREIVGGSSGAGAGAAIDYDYNGPGKTKPTLAAVRVMDVLRGVTAQYARVRAFRQRLRFLVDIQVTVLDAYDERLGDALEAYYAMTSSAVARTLHGVSREQRAALEGTGALEALCRVYGSADHVVRTLRTWGDEAFFVQLRDELEARAGRGGGGGGKDNDDDDDNKDKSENGSLFDETIANFARRRAAAQAFLVTALATANRKAFRPYVLRTQWAGSGHDGGGSSSTGGGMPAPSAADLAVTPELDEPLRVLSRNLGFLARALGTAALRRTVREAGEQLQNLLWRDVLMAQRFSALGAAQFARDVGAVAAVVAQHVPAASAKAALGGLQEAVRLLALPVGGGGDGDGDGDGITLQQASDRVFTDNAEARRLLGELGLTLVTTANARLILQRRVEV